ncbi:MAG: hypothetical protein V1913_08955, partial [Fibrobacterota bacterium]
PMVMRKHLSIVSLMFLLSFGNPNKAQDTVQGSPSILSNTDVKQNFLASEKGEIIFDGYIGEPMGHHYYIMIFLNRTSKDIYEGKYLYKSVQKFIKLEGKTIGNQLELIERDAKGETTGRFTGVISEFNSTISGNWSKPDGRGPLSFYASKIIPVGINNPGNYEFAHLKSIKTKNEKRVQVTGLPDSIQLKVNNLLNVKKALEMQELNYEVLYNLNGILTIAYTQKKEDGWWSTNYLCINLKNGGPLTFDDIFKSESRSEIHNLAIVKTKEGCPEQLDFDDVKEFSTNSNKLDFPIVEYGGVSFISPCERSAGYFLGARLLSITFEKIKPFLKMK